jgi:hypothetical protein
MPTQVESTEAQGLELVRDLEVPPAGFSAVTASQHELRRYGLPLRPDQDIHPVQAALWDRFASRSLRFVRPSLEPFPDRPPSELRDLRTHKLHADPIEAETIERALHQRGIRLCQLFPTTSSNWSGAKADRPSSEQLVTVTGEWVVPAVVPPQSAWNGKAYDDGTYICVVWVGLDGTDGTGDVLQAGTGSQVDVSGGVVTSTSYFAWTEWFGNAWKVADQFPVNPGESILCTVCAPFDNDHGAALFVNQTTGLAWNHPIDPPANVALTGNVAEWIVEDPTNLSTGFLYPFPNYGLATFTNCAAGTKHISLDLGDACPINLTDGAGKVISQGTIDSDTTMTCNFLT